MVMIIILQPPVNALGVEHVAETILSCLSDTIMNHISKSQLRPALLGQLTVRTEGSSGAFLGLITTMSSQGMPMAESGIDNQRARFDQKPIKILRLERPSISKKCRLGDPSEDLIQHAMGGHEAKEFVLIFVFA
ncbi:hypothetical protein ACFX11_012335 [Malus domestica]